MRAGCVLKAKYIGNDSGVERLRPMVARTSCTTRRWRKRSRPQRPDLGYLRSVAKKNRVRIVEPQAQIPLDDPGQTIRDFKATTGNLDIDCPRSHDDAAGNSISMRCATGPTPGQSATSTRCASAAPSQQEACRAAVSSNPRLREQLETGIARMDEAWLAAVEKALRENANERSCRWTNCCAPIGARRCSSRAATRSSHRSDLNARARRLEPRRTQEHGESNQRSWIMTRDCPCLRRAIAGCAPADLYLRILRIPCSQRFTF